MEAGDGDGRGEAGRLPCVFCHVVTTAAPLHFPLPPPWLPHRPLSLLSGETSLAAFLWFFPTHTLAVEFLFEKRKNRRRRTGRRRRRRGRSGTLHTLEGAEGRQGRREGAGGGGGLFPPSSMCCFLSHSVLLLLCSLSVPSPCCFYNCHGHACVRLQPSQLSLTLIQHVTAVALCSLSCVLACCLLQHNFSNGMLA